MELLDKEVERILNEIEYYIDIWVAPGIRESKKVTKEIYNDAELGEMIVKGSLVTKYEKNKMTLIIQ